jgi:SAM-dependent methyltransferase
MTSPARNELTSPDYWDAPFWEPGEDASALIRFDPENLEFRDIHRCWKRHLPRRTDFTFLEIGCHPGRYLWYFHHEFGYRVHGIEYAPRACERTRRLLDSLRLPARVEEADVFMYAPPEPRGFDVVCSVGLIEHFVDVAPIIRRHVELVAPGGYLVLIIPNHRGINGWVVDRLLPEVAAVHNHMSYAQLRAAVLAHPEMRVVTGGYYGRFHLAPSNFCPTMQAHRTPAVYRWIERCHRYAMRGGQWLPNNRWLSPYCGLIARKGVPR